MLNQADRREISSSPDPLLVLAAEKRKAKSQKNKKSRKSLHVMTSFSDYIYVFLLVLFFLQLEPNQISACIECRVNRLGRNVLFCPVLSDYARP
jgi:hypothetical protein